MVTILGINDSHDASVCIVQDGKLLCAIQEERLSRVKSTGGFPWRSLVACLSFCGLTGEDIDQVAVAGIRAVPVNMLGTLSTFSKYDHWLVQEKKRRPHFADGTHISFREIFPNYTPKADPLYSAELVPLADTGELTAEHLAAIQQYRHDFIARHVGVPRNRVAFFDHHSCHAYYAFYASPRRSETLALTMDGGGDGVYESIGVFGEDGSYRKIHAAHGSLLGKLYSFTTLLLGMRPHEDEYKLMGLAPYGAHKPSEIARKAYRECLGFEGLVFSRRGETKDLFRYLCDRLKTERFDSIAFELQQFTEDMLVAWTSAAREAVGCNHIVFAGGVANNVKANKRIAESAESLFVPAGPGDESLSIGAAWMAAAESGAAIEPPSNAYWGPTIEQEEIERFLNHPAVRGRYTIANNQSPNYLAALVILRGGIVAVCRDRMEFGSRALGNRSLVANAMDVNSIRKMNHAVKNRDFWMPFAPSISKEALGEFVKDNGKMNLSYMTGCLSATLEGKTYMPACIHPEDGTARVHCVEDGSYCNLVDRLGGVVLNTSLNIHGKPIVMTLKDLAEELLANPKVRIDGLLVGDLFLARNT